MDIFKRCFFGFSLILICFILSCQNQNKAKYKYIKPPPPPAIPSAEEYCDSLRARTYNTLQNGTIELVIDDTIRSVEKTILFKKILKKKFNLQLLPIFDSIFYPRCIMPIMDSAITSKYGINGKDSIVNLVNHLTDSIFAIKEGEEINF